MIPSLIGAGLGALVGLGFCRLAYRRIPGFRAIEMIVAVGGAACAGAITSLVVHSLAQQISHGFMRYPVVVFAGIVVVWICGDFLHAILMRRCYTHWNSAIPRDIDGIRKGCREFTVGEGRCALLMIHGFADSPSVFQRMGPALAERGFHCRALRLPYFAMDMEQQRRTNVADWRNSIRDEIQAVRDTHDRVVVVAHSMGAAIALDYLLDHSDEVDGIVMLAPLIEVSGQRSPLLAPHIWYRILDATLIFTPCAATWFAASLRDAGANALINEDRFVARAVYRSMFAVLGNNRRRGVLIDKPLLVMLSQNDKVVDNGAAESFFHMCNSSHKRLIVMEDTSHVLPLDSSWLQIVEEIVQFERELLSTNA